MYTKLAITLVSAYLCASAAAFAWNSTGHEIIADIAYKNLPPPTRDVVDQILQDHPKYDQWKINAIEATGSEENEQVPLFVFIQASTWADEIRHTGSQFDHPQWHFVDYPFDPTTATPSPRSPSPRDDVLFGLFKSAKTLKDEQSTSEERAAALAWIIHLAGDSHQPLHCASLFSIDYPEPDGDRGGNSLYIKPSSKGIKLHSFWDGLLGNSKQAKDLAGIDRDAVVLSNKYPSSEFGVSTVSAEVVVWTRESYALAINAAYAKGALFHAHTAGEARAVPAGYTKLAQEVAEKQAAVAGYRLAHFITKALSL